VNIVAELLVDGSGEGRAVAERLQVKLHDLGVSLRVLAVPRREFEQRLGAGQFDAALVGLPALPDAGLNLAQVLLLVMPLEAVQQELAAIGAIADPAARRERARSRALELLPSLPVVPLYAQGLGVSVGQGVRGFRFEASGTVDLGALWLEAPESRSATQGTP
jgi:peptide/nickel transport system substrate-binding protein